MEDRAYLERLGFLAGVRVSAGDVWARLADPVLADLSVRELHDQLRVILEQSPLAERIVQALGRASTRARLREVYGWLCDCVETGESFTRTPPPPSLPPRLPAGP